MTRGPQISHEYRETDEQIDAALRRLIALIAAQVLTEERDATPSSEVTPNEPKIQQAD